MSGIDPGKARPDEAAAERKAFLTDAWRDNLAASLNRLLCPRLARAGARRSSATLARPQDAAALTREARPAGPTHAWTWAGLMRRALDLDVLACPRWGGRPRLPAQRLPGVTCSLAASRSSCAWTIRV